MLVSLSKEISDFVGSYTAIQKTRYMNWLMGQKAGKNDVANGANDAAQRARRAWTAAHPQGTTPAIPPAPSASPTAQKPGLGDNRNAMLLHKELVKRGVDPIVADGAVGAAMGESGRGLNPSTYVADDNGGPSGGMLQWHDGPDSKRLTGLYSFAGKNDINQIDPTTQASYFGHELDTTHAGVLAALKQAKPGDMSAGNDIMVRKFEVPKDADGQVAARAPYGQSFSSWRLAQSPTPRAIPAPDPTQMAGDVPGYAAGGAVVAKHGGKSRPDREASAQPGIPPRSDVGMGPGGGYSSPTAISPGYADGGAVSGDDDPSDPTSNQNLILASNQVPLSAGSGNESPPQTDILQGLGDAIGMGLKHLQTTFGLDGSAGGALPGNPTHASGVQRLASGEGAMSPEDYHAATSAVDPEGKLTEGMRATVGLKAMVDYYLDRGDPVAAGKVAAALLQRTRLMASEYGDRAVGSLHRGDTAGAVKEVVDGYNNSMPDGRVASARMNPDGSADTTISDATGRPIKQMRVTPQQLLAAAVGLKDGSEFWKQMIAVAGKNDVAPEENGQSDAFKQFSQEQSGGQGGTPSQQPASAPAAASPQAIPSAPKATPVATPATPAPTAPAPVASAGSDDEDTTGAIPAPGVTGAGNPQTASDPEPRVPSNLMQMNADEQKQVLAYVRTQHAAWQQRQAALAGQQRQEALAARQEKGLNHRAAMQANTEVFKMQNERDMLGLQNEKPQDYRLTDTDKKEAVDTALVGAGAWGKDTNPPPAVKNGLRFVTGQIIGHNRGMDEETAAGAVMRLIQPGEIGASVKPFAVQPVPNDPYDRVRVSFSDGLTPPLFLPKSSLTILDTLRGQQAQQAFANVRDQAIAAGREQDRKARQKKFYDSRPQANSLAPGFRVPGQGVGNGR